VSVPTIIVSRLKMVGTPSEAHSRRRSLCPPHGLDWRDMSSNGLLSTACQPYRAMVNLRNIFRKIMATTLLHGAGRRPAFAVKKPRLAARKIARIPVAFGSPQDFHIALMFGAARFAEPALSGSRGVGFRFAPRRRRWLQRLGHTPQVLQSTPDF
jgi:hypothetical protein